MAEPLENLAAHSLADLARIAEGQSLPPVEMWNPQRVGDANMRIASDGTWFHDGSPIHRPNMVRVFSRILIREEDGRHFLVTPVEKLFIEVDDAAFLAVEFKTEGTGEHRTLVFRLNTGELVQAGALNRLCVRGTQDEPLPYLHVRGGLEARLTRSVFYELAELAIDEGAEPSGIWSSGEFFSLVPQ